jgi:hypothetical protein
VVDSPYDLTIGNSTKYLRWDGTAGALTIGGDMTIFNNIGGGASSIKIDGNTITVYDSSNYARVKIGNLA